MSKKKECKNCKNDLPLTAFGSNPLSKDKTKNICKECEKEKRKITDDYKNNFFTHDPYYKIGF